MSLMPLVLPTRISCKQCTHVRAFQVPHEIWTLAFLALHCRLQYCGQLLEDPLADKTPTIESWLVLLALITN